ncbi:hypothetical protein SAMD00019534_123480 [Acytostelium subglobosum LB1]|uniref:hypothetical protein n=1 Tax=Acytostelium subglobosum LB1 TaxID=1410327 RepID=UPI000645161F|nr:hypothetical protein SAMD00019534_123480 [Acytostelium subglobosum LB1]GAM29172.1 hypothetical protein SAMD00019534_123480 [Acytostelium subglobosum LB1]|eukprot:XP_012747863.1 hypothetical protein SAMD00019534_123480 [Acytostelium subglobosum LB1]
MCAKNNGGCSGNCSSTNGVRTCSCTPPLVLAPDKQSCVGQDYCKTNNGGCNQICANTIDAPTCSCYPGYTLNVKDLKTCEKDKFQILSTNTPTVYHNQRGLITIYGDGFGAAPNPKVTGTIGDAKCLNVTRINSTALVCDFAGDATPADKGESLYVNITIDGVTSSNQVFFYIQYFPCPGNCNGNGVCNNQTGECTCNEGFGRQDCSEAKQTNNIPPPQVDNDGNTVFNLSGVGTNVTLSIKYLREVSNIGEEIKLLRLSDIEWTNRTASIESPTYTYSGRFKNSTVVLDLQIVYYAKASKTEFAGESIQIYDNSIKYTIGISNWAFGSSLNYLQVVYQTQVLDPCDKMSFDKSFGVANGGSYPYMTMDTGEGVVMEGRFASRMIVDERIVKSSFIKLPLSDQLYNESAPSTPGVFVALTANVISAFGKSVKLDPNFGVIVSLDSGNDGTCGQGGSKGISWKVPVIVVCSVVGAALLTVGMIFLVRSRFVQFRVHEMKLKNISSKD